MNKREFFLKAMAAKCYQNTAWNITAFSVVSEGPNDWMEKPSAYRVVQMPNGFFFVDPDDMGRLQRIDDAMPGQPLFRSHEPLFLDPQDLPNVYESGLTTYGNALANMLTLVYGFGGKIPFVSGRMNIGKIEGIIEKRLTEDPEGHNENEPEHMGQTIPTGQEPLYISEYLRFCNGTFSTVAYTQLFTPAVTEKTMTAPPGIVELRTKLVKQFQGRLHDRAVVAHIVTELQKLDAEYLKGDRGEGFLISDKSRKIVRSRLFLSYGAETGIEEKVDVDYIQPALVEGWDLQAFPAMNNALRAGSFNRGKQTELGGESVKDILRATGNMKISAPDCGSTLGIPEIIVKGDEHNLIGFSVVEEDGQSTKITADNVSSYMGRVIRKRSPMTCKMDKTDFCAVCLGDRLANNPTGLSMATADYGSTFLAIYMSAAHSKGIQVAKLDWKRQLK